MELLFLMIFFVIVIAADWVTKNIVLVMTITILLFLISISRNIADLVYNKRENHYIDGELIAAIVVKVALCVAACLAVYFLF